MILAMVGWFKRGGRIGKWQDESLIREMRRIFERERKAHATGDDELAKRLARHRQELNKKRKSS